MIAFLLAAALAANSAGDLAHCVEKKDRACAATLLKREAANTSPDYLAEAAKGYMLLNKREDALKAIGRALAERPNDFGLLMEQGWLFQRSGDQPAAIHSFLLAAKTKPDSPDVFYEIGMSFFFAHEYERAKKHFERTLQLKPDHDRAEFMLGILAIWNEQLDLAAPYFKRAIELRPNSADYLLHYGVLLMKLNENDAALIQMKEAEKMDGGNPLTRLNLGRLYRLEGKLPEAREELETALRLRPNLSSAAYQLATVYREMGDEAKATEMLKRFQALNTAENAREEDPIDASVSH